jgi:DNA-binding response OmpR family regulator
VIKNATVLSVCTDDVDRVSLEHILHESAWSVYTNSDWNLIATFTLASAFSILQETPVAILLCDSDLCPGAWREMLDHISLLSDPPLLIVTGRLADERLWAEALNLGAYDVLSKPYDSAEVSRIIGLAWLHWLERHGVHRRRTEQRKAEGGD